MVALISEEPHVCEEEGEELGTNLCLPLTESCRNSAITAFQGRKFNSQPSAAPCLRFPSCDLHEARSPAQPSPAGQSFGGHQGFSWATKAGRVLDAVLCTPFSLLLLFLEHPKQQERCVRCALFHKNSLDFPFWGWKAASPYWR